jgi:hypothetical protein
MRKSWPIFRWNFPPFCLPSYSSCLLLTCYRAFTLGPSRVWARIGYRPPPGAVNLTSFRYFARNPQNDELFLRAGLSVVCSQIISAVCCCDSWISCWNTVLGQACGTCIDHELMIFGQFHNRTLSPGMHPKPAIVHDYELVPSTCTSYPQSLSL